MGLRLNGTEGAQACPPPLVSEGRGPHLGAQQASWARVGRANALLSSPAPLVLKGPSSLPLLISPASFLCPQDQCGQGWWEPWRAGDQPGSSAGSPGPSGWAIALCSSPNPPGGPLRLPLLISLASGAPMWPPLLLPPQSPHILPVRLGVPPISLAVRVPPSAASRCPSRGET